MIIRFRLWTAALTFIVTCSGLACGGEGRSTFGEAPADPATYVGGDTCATCHAEEAEAWSGSHHDLAMQEATPSTVLGDFRGATFTHFGTTSTFTTRGETLVIRTEDSEGNQAEFDVAYAFGVFPLQQYLIGLEGGRYQAFSVAWDSREAVEGGQRWFSLYPDEQIGPGDPLHWTAPSMNWNYMCAECHSTDLKKNFDLVTTSYATSWSDIDVSCEACHGPGSRHLEIARRQKETGAPNGSTEAWGLNRAMADPGGGWVIDAAETIARRTVSLPDDAQVETCAHCHSRRATIATGRVAGTSLHDTDIVSRLDEGLYHADGQILDEVYVYGSFVQSKMYAAGVRCSDCHDPHSLELKASGNAVCSGCHLPAAYDTTAHHNHPAGSTGAQCVECHMPSTTYMVVDPRRDHSMRVPRPHLTQRIGTPNGCNACHADEPVTWAVAAIDRWYDRETGAAEHFGDVLYSARSGLPGSAARLRALATSADQPGIIRATALALMANQPSAAMLPAIESGSNDPDPLVRLGAIAALEAYPPDLRLRSAFEMLRDSIRAVRTEAARVLAHIPAGSLSAPQRSLLAEVTSEYLAAQMVNADHPGTHVNAGNLHIQRGRPDLAEPFYSDALRIDSTFAPAYLNLADLYRVLGRDADGRAVLEAGLRVAADDANLHHAMGLTLVRLGEAESAIQWLARAVELARQQPRFAYVLGVALNSVGDSDGAVRVLTTSLAQHPYDRELLTLLALLHRDRGEAAMALEYAERLVEVAPDDPASGQLLRDLRRLRG